MTATHDLRVEALDATFGAIIEGVRLARLDDATFARIYDHWLEYALLIFPDQHLDAQEQLALARRFGELEFDLAPISNVKPDGSLRDAASNDDVMKILKGNMGWHSDSTYMPVQAKGAVFTAQVVPPSGGETAWADMRAAYDALDPELRERVGGYSAHHSLVHSQSLLGHAAPEPDSEYGGYGFDDSSPPLRPLVKIHPETGRPSLLIGRHAYGIPGLEPEESERLLEELVELACQPPRVHQHRWSPGDAVIWDNRCLLHRACAWDMSQPRVMTHARIAGDPTSESARPPASSIG
jgi:alpha-ketoglutarate-dependent taurine dioxygenase